MQTIRPSYDAAIVGGGLAGLACAIQLGRNGYSVILFEKEKYPFHKVCGEYISFESWNFLYGLGVPLDEWELPRIKQLQLTAPSGNAFTTTLPLGGFGVSRYRLDAELARIAKHYDVHLLEGTKVEDITRHENFELHFSSKTNGNGVVRAKVCGAAFGKRSNLDLKWKRSFLNRHDKRLDNYVAIKYHMQADWEDEVIGLHNFKDGYCGISKIEDGLHCVCYMTRASNLKACDNDVNQLQQQVLSRNPFLKNIFLKSTLLKEFPITISQINFSGKTQVEKGVLMLGDAAGMITPLCGNGMSIALHTGKMASQIMSEYLSGELTQKEMETCYEVQWKKNFSSRLKAGRMLQRFFGSTWLSNAFVLVFQAFPFLARRVIKLTHGKPF